MDNHKTYNIPTLSWVLAPKEVPSHHSPLPALTLLVVLLPLPCCRWLLGSQTDCWRELPWGSPCDNHWHTEELVNTTNYLLVPVGIPLVLQLCGQQFSLVTRALSYS